MLFRSRFPERWTVFFADMLRVRSGQDGGPQLLAYVNRSVAEKKPYDEMVRELIATNGRPESSPAAGFALGDAANAPHYAASLRRFTDQLAARRAEWDKLAAPLRGVKVVTYHKSFDYLAARFGFDIVGQIEPKPGLEPTPTHISALIPQAKAAGVRIVLMEPNRARKTPQFVAESIGAKLVVCPGLVGGAPEAKTCLDLIDHDLRLLVKAVQP